VDQKINWSIHKSKASLIEENNNTQISCHWYSVFQNSPLYGWGPLTCDKLSIPDAYKTRALCFSQIIVTCWSSSSEVKRCREKCCLKAGNRWRSLGSKSRLHGGWYSVTNRKLTAISESAVFCAVEFFFLPRTWITPFLWRSRHFPYPHKACNCSDFKARPVFQMGHNFELPQQCSFCTYASNHVIMELEPCAVYISDNWNFALGL
jgi:hypothetical protein